MVHPGWPLLAHTELVAMISLTLALVLALVLLSQRAFLPICTSPSSFHSFSGAWTTSGRPGLNWSIDRAHKKGGKG